MKQKYDSPSVEVLLVTTERGFAGSTPENMTGTTEEVGEGPTY